ncbi:unnamed protein product [Clonostachys rosea f. rosea IK726]|uniref:aldehyde dehydrogenase (NAD(+)) n=2 Tax=Bionectria ochroleuca TaxID=29856 RepID=A0A0B7KPK3_BIOOC|nr:unnamed protein product [Clonostachys rosea f. rosea IK726]
MATPDFSTFRNVIAGSLRSSPTMGHSIDPSTRKPLWDVPIATVSDLNDAVTAAQAAFLEWSRLSWKDRQAHLRQIQSLLIQHRPSMARLVSSEGGKPPQFGDLEVQHALDFLEFYSGCEEPKPEVVQDDKSLRLTLYHEPLGVIGAICPWNYPLVLAIGKIAPALLTGNCIILKPSPFTPYSILKLVDIVMDTLPAGVLQAIHGDDKLGPALCSHPGIHKITFTGSTATGKKISASAGLKNVTLELGGNNASIICPDININEVAPQVALGAFFNSGQLCVASKRIYVHGDIYDKFLKAMVDVVKNWKVGPPSLEGVMLGPVQNEMQYNVVRSIFEDTARNGYKFALGGDQKPDQNSFLISPAIIDCPPDTSTVVQKEAFGPIVPLMRWTNEPDLIARVNDTSTGLGGTVWSKDLDYAYRLASKIEAGTIWINGFERPLPQAYLEGHKDSGIGGEWGKHGISSYLKRKMIHHYKSSPPGAKL